MADTTKSEVEKQLLRDEMLGAIEQIAGSKRQRLEDLRDPRNFISSDKPRGAVVGDEEEGGGQSSMKVNRSSLWSENEKSFLENVTMDLIPDDDAMNVTGKTVRKWDKVKKRYILQKVDREGKVMRERRNESGKKVTNKMKDNRNNAYKNWQSRTHLTL